MSVHCHYVSVYLTIRFYLSFCITLPPKFAFTKGRPMYKWHFCIVIALHIELYVRHFLKFLITFIINITGILMAVRPVPTGFCQSRLPWEEKETRKEKSRCAVATQKEVRQLKLQSCVHSCFAVLPWTH